MFHSFCSLAEAVFFVHSWGRLLGCALNDWLHKRRPLYPSHSQVGYQARLMCTDLSPVWTASIQHIVALSYKTLSFSPRSGRLQGELTPYAVASSLRNVQRSLVSRVVFSDSLFISTMAKGSLPTEPFYLRARTSSAPPRENAWVLCPLRAFMAYMEITADPVLFVVETPFCYSQHMDPTDFLTFIH